MAVVVASTLVVSDVGTQQGQISGKEIVESAHVVKETTLHYLSTDLASIDQMMGNLMKECTNLRQQLQEATLLPDTSAIQIYQAQNPEAASFWKDRFQSDELNVSAFRYETLYVSWARFVHEVEASFVLKKIPTGVCEARNMELARQEGSWYRID